MKTNNSQLTWFLSVIVAAVFAISASGCGSSEGDSDANEGGSGNATAAEREVRELIRQVGAAIENQDIERFCQFLTPAAREQGVQLGKQLGVRGSTTCSETLGALLRTGTFVEDPHPRIVSIEVAGGRAVVVADVSHERANQKGTFVRRDGRWRVAAWFIGRGAGEPSRSGQ